MPLEEAMQLIEQGIIAPLKESPEMKSGQYRITLSGTADKLRQTWDALWFNLILAVVITYLTMAAMFESWLYPFVIITSVPLGAVGGFAGLWLLNHVLLMPFGHFQPLDVLTMLGFVMLVGTVVNNPILIVEQALIHMRDEGMPQRKAIIESVKSRIRPIFMTTLAGLIGLLPLVVSPGAGSELYRGIGAVLLGGMIVSTVFTLVLVPTLFSLLLDLKDIATRQFALYRSAELITAEPLPPDAEIADADEPPSPQESAVA
jgi:HAE1 family hydrophobic/amphiphilic exporter-1